MARSKDCPPQQWHTDNNNGYFMVMPVYPCDGPEDRNVHYSLSVVNGSHKLKDVDYDSTEQMREQLNNILHLQLKVGQVSVANANIIHRGGPNSDYRNLLGTDSNFQENELKMPGMRNLSIHGYLTQKGEKNDEANTKDNISFIKIPVPEG